MESMGKRKAVFPPFPQPLEIDKAYSHIPIATTTTRINISSSWLVMGYAF
jgi:hypothetical protein